ncbi:hypothetical protein N2152v2_009029 [Parachlorella kessleri]
MAAQANFVRVKVETVEGAAASGSGAAAAAGPPPRSRLLCVVRGLLKKIKQSVLVGDEVRVVGIDWADGRGMVEEVLSRRSELSDPAVANVDHMVLVFAADLPPWQPAQVTRYLVGAEAAGLPVTLVVNKADLVPPEDVQSIVDQVAAWGYQALPVSVVSGTGLPALSEQLQRRVSVVAGPSGAGKSSIINALRLKSAGMDGSLEAMLAQPTSPHGSSSVGDSSVDDSSGGCETVSSSNGIAEPGHAGHMTADGRSSSSSSLVGTAVTAEFDTALGPSREASGNTALLAGTPPPPPQQQQQWDEGADVHQPKSQAALLDESSLEAAGDGCQCAAGEVEAASEIELQAVGDVSQRIGRGKHTTRNVTLLELGGGALLADTPGFNQPVLDLPAAQLADAFPEIRRILSDHRCAFGNCQHLVEPGCAVREAEWDRYPYYVDLHAELAQHEQVELERAASKKKREGNVRFKSRAGGKQGMEARLESKSHRRVSRRSVKQSVSQLAKGVDEDGSDY